MAPYARVSYKDLGGSRVIVLGWGDAIVLVQRVSRRAIGVITVEPTEGLE